MQSNRAASPVSSETYIRDGEDGFLGDRTVSALRDGIVGTLALTPAERVAMQSVARRTVLDLFSDPAALDRICDFVGK